MRLEQWASTIVVVWWMPKQPQSIWKTGTYPIIYVIGGITAGVSFSPLRCGAVETLSETAIILGRGGWIKDPRVYQGCVYAWSEPFFRHFLAFSRDSVSCICHWRLGLLVSVMSRRPSVWSRTGHACVQAGASLCRTIGTIGTVCPVCLRKAVNSDRCTDRANDH